MKKVLITGPDGFIGAHCVDHLLQTTDWHLVLLASWTHGGLSARLSESEHLAANRDRVKVVTFDLNAPIDNVTAERIGRVDAVIHFASCSDVDLSLTDPTGVIRNNVNCAVNLLEWARQHQPLLEQFILISTDEVYGPAPAGHDSKEWDAILPSNPYSASKAAQEAIAISYWRSYGVPVIIANSMNLIGERQAATKFVPMIMRNALTGRPITIHTVDGVPGSRMYLHARNYANACRWMIRRGRPGTYDPERVPGPKADRPDRWNVVGELELDNLDMANLVLASMRRAGAVFPIEPEVRFIDAHSKRPGHDARYALDGSKIASAGWLPPVKFQDSLDRLVAWTMENREWIHLTGAS